MKGKRVLQQLAIPGDGVEAVQPIGLHHRPVPVTGMGDSL